MSGTVLAGTPIAVDFWSLRRAAGARLFFLSHMHADHTVGLSSTWSRPLYCSPITARLLHSRLRVGMAWPDPRHLGTPIAPPARPCLQHLGVPTSPPVWPHPTHLGTSIAHPSHPALITQVPLFLHLSCPAQPSSPALPSPPGPCRCQPAGSGRWRPDVFTAEEGAGWIRAVDVAEIRWDTLVTWNTLHPTIAILPTGRPVKVTHPKIHPIPYSDHSSFSELREFVKWLKPCSIIPIVKGSMCQVYFQEYLSSAPQVLPDFQVPKPLPESVQQQSQRKGQDPTCLWKRAARHSAPQGVVFESPEKYTEKPEAFTSAEIPQQHHCEPASCSKEGCTCHRDEEKGKEKLSGEELGAAGAATAVSQAPVSKEHFTAGFAERYLLTPLNVLKQNSSWTFDKLVQDFFRRGE
ncbi:5' exonuclease Apollo, partial [Manacus vitellinus]